MMSPALFLNLVALSCMEALCVKYIYILFFGLTRSIFLDKLIFKMRLIDSQGFN